MLILYIVLAALFTWGSGMVGAMFGIFAGLAVELLPKKIAGYWVGHWQRLKTELRDDPYPTVGMLAGGMLGVFSYWFLLWYGRHWPFS